VLGSLLHQANSDSHGTRTSRQCRTRVPNAASAFRTSAASPRASSITTRIDQWILVGAESHSFAAASAQRACQARTCVVAEGATDCRHRSRRQWRQHDEREQVAPGLGRQHGRHDPCTSRSYAVRRRRDVDGPAADHADFREQLASPHHDRDLLRPC
jgi:hypothetical protein